VGAWSQAASSPAKLRATIRRLMRTSLARA
jgi:hypothetical protein